MSVFSPSSSSMNLEIRQLFKSFGSNAVLKGIDMDLPAGASLVVLGGSGSGKSVMLKCILGLLTPDAGEVILGGRAMNRLREREREEVLRHCGVLFQGSALFDSLPVWENVAFALLQRRGYRRSQARDEAIETLATVGLSERAALSWPSELSGGMQRRVALARAIMTRPAMLFFDEPTTGLDPIMSSVISGLIRDATQKLGATAITITHDITSARRIADRFAMIHEGRILWTGTSLDHATDPIVDQFIHGRPTGPWKLEGESVSRKP